jgi:negative regulator of sigma E activity
LITIKTGNKRNAGTDANVFVQLYGLDGKTEEIMLRNNTDNFEKGHVKKHTL